MHPKAYEFPHQSVAKSVLTQVTSGYLQLRQRSAKLAMLHGRAPCFEVAATQALEFLPSHALLILRRTMLFHPRHSWWLRHDVLMIHSKHAEKVSLWTQSCKLLHNSSQASRGKQSASVSSVKRSPLPSHQLISAYPTGTVDPAPRADYRFLSPKQSARGFTEERSTYHDRFTSHCLNIHLPLTA